MPHIVDMVIDAYVDYMQAKLNDELTDPDDPTRVVLIRGGRLQENPVSPETYLLMHANRPGETNWRHTGSTTESATPYGLRSDMRHLAALPQFEIGGLSMMWWRRLSSEIGCFFLPEDYDRETAREYSHMIFGRFEYYLMRANIDNDAGILGLVDDFGERAMQVYLHSSNYNEGGGPPSDFIWRGEFWFDVLTERSFD